ncbi:MAG: beta-N-acetylhexosaminidase [Candidatus Cloacimonadota bacterium]|nr:MAG: beta-N-acetylhexosaminidase [Candidatus Cloacimonadota bacterium]PIE78166.1 MAG: beta-N-acetylhexosaminidase [Candidatus Delongbacteria bacterium]
MNIVPKPYKISKREGFIKLPKNLSIYIENFENYKFSTFIKDLYSKFNIGFKRDSKFKIDLELNSSLSHESYILDIDESITIKSKEEKGFLYGLLSLIQLFDESIFDSDREELKLKKIYIEDKPSLGYRGMHLDVSRHFFKADFIKKYIDILAFYKLNSFHWHLTDDNGWRVEIKKYPKLQEISAWRAPRTGSWLSREEEKEGEERSYGGYYTQDEIREIVEYAKDRSIEIIPEIEMPGHSVEVIAAYPELGCFNQKVTVPTGSYWPNDDIFCGGKEEVFTFIENVLDEVIPLFPSKYFHIGGDEACKTNWDKCPLCKKRMEEHGLKDSKELQSYFIKRIEKFLNSRGKDLLGWDEILEGGLAPNAIVFSWQNEDGGIEACKNGNRAVMVPNSHLYFDHYQSDEGSEARAFGGYSPIKRVYSYNPIPSKLEGKEKDFILGTEGCLWTEWVPTESHAEYMLLPRLVALSETAWCSSEDKCWEKFKAKLPYQYKILDSLGYNHGTGSTVLDITRKFIDGRYLITVDSEIIGSEIYYSMGGEFKLYEKPIEIESSVKFVARQLLNGKQIGKDQTLVISSHKGFGKRSYYNKPFSHKYPSTFEYGLSDGVYGGLDHTSEGWQGFEEGINLYIDLEEIVNFSKVNLNLLERKEVHIFLPKKLEISISSDNLNYETVYSDNSNYSSKEGKSIKEYSVFGDFKARYIRVKANSFNREEVAKDLNIPIMWLFLDQVTIE